MIPKECTLDNKKKLYVVLHGECLFPKSGNWCSEKCSCYSSYDFQTKALLLKLQIEITNILNFFTATANSKPRIVAVVDNHLRSSQQFRIFEDYRVVCDETNNSTHQLQTVVDVYVKPVRAASIIQLNFIIN
jgi:hypothetical protein